MRYVSLLFLIVLCASNANAWRCGSSLVELEDLKKEVLEHCGKPTARYSRQIPYEVEVGDTHKRKRYQPVDYWVYLNGPNKLARILSFRDGVLGDIRSGDYSDTYRRDPDQCRRGSITIEINQTQPELELRCGAPDATITVEEFSTAVAADESHRILRNVLVYEWLYFKGDSVYVYRFHNGVLKWLGERDRDRYDPLL